MLRHALLLLVVMSAPARAEDGPSFDCTKAETSAETLICEDTELSRLDRLVSARFAAALKAARALDAGSDEAEAELRAIQRGWISGRDECWKADDLRSCVENAYTLREGELVALWMLEAPSNTAFWQCDGNPANEVVTVFFDTERPSVRFERGDTVDAGVLVRTASGAKYEGSFGRSIWIKGDAATYREASPDGSTFDCVLVNKD